MKCDKIKTVFKDIIDDDVKEFARVNKNSFTRNRKMCYEDFMILLLGRKGLTTTMELNNFFKIKIDVKILLVNKPSQNNVII